MDKEIEQLIALYKKVSKHSNYQILYPSLQKIISQDKELYIKSRYEQERFDYICSKINFNNKICGDVGGNTGYFSFAALEQDAEFIYYYDGNYTHANFVTLASQILKNNHKLEVNAEYINLAEESLTNKVDILFLLNVLHHIGDDYGTLSTNNVLEHITNVLNALATQTDILIFQMGFNWKGNRNLPIFKSGTKEEMVNFIHEQTKTHWDIQDIGIAKKQNNNTVKYNDLSCKNIHRNDELGEFLNRPLFIMRSKILIDKAKYIDTTK